MMSDNISTPLQLEYRGYVIHFAENQEVWRCSALDVEGEKISTVKRKVDKVVAASRKIPLDLTAMSVDYYNRVTEVRIVAFAQPRKSGQEPDSVWCMYTDSERYFDHSAGKYAYRDTQVRKKFSLASIYADTVENRATFFDIHRLEAEKRQIDERIKIMKEEATKLNLSDLKTDDTGDE